MEGERGGERDEKGWKWNETRHRGLIKIKIWKKSKQNTTSLVLTNWWLPQDRISVLSHCVSLLSWWAECYAVKWQRLKSGREAMPFIPGLVVKRQSDLRFPNRLEGPSWTCIPCPCHTVPVYTDSDEVRWIGCQRNCQLLRPKLHSEVMGSVFLIWKCHRD